MELITIDQAAERLGLHAATVRSWVRQGRIPAYRTGERFIRLNWAEVVAQLKRDPSSPTSPLEQVEDRP